MKSLNRELRPLVAFGGGGLCGEVHQLAVELVREREMRKQLKALIVVLFPAASLTTREKLHCDLCCGYHQTELDYVGSIKKMVRSHRVQLASDRLKGVIPSL